MTTEKIYDTIKGWEATEENYQIKLQMQQMSAKLAEEMAMQNAKKEGGKTGATILKAAKRIVPKNDKREILNGLNPDKTTGHWAVCDGFRFVMFKHKLNIPESPVANDVNRQLDYSRLIPQYDGISLPLPPIADVKTYCQTHKIPKCKKSEPYMLTDSNGVNIWVDPQFLIDMMECLPDATAISYGKKNGIYFEAENGVGLLLPVHHQD